jgi:hypothetical protein
MGIASLHPSYETFLRYQPYHIRLVFIAFGQIIFGRNLKQTTIGAVMPLSEEAALRAYARMLNTLNSATLEPLLADDFVYESQHVFQPIESKKNFIDYIRPKLITIQQAKATVFAEMGTVEAYGKVQPCVILAQNEKENLVALALAKVDGPLLKRIDLCIVPPPHTAERSGEYPT